MSDIIHLLPDSVANQIAAGEVIQRPASVIKELMENAIDAGATTIHVLIKGAGRTSIQVIDNGCGMSSTDARMSFERHATSKITEANDLYALTTMGFRGEALASIAAVATVELKTRTADSEVGTLLEIAASRVVRQEKVSCAVGSSFTVKNLFFNIPARRKFLKSEETEMHHIIADFQRIVLTYPNIHFELISGDDIVYQLPQGNLKQRITAIFGKKTRNLNNQLLQIEAVTPVVKIYGFVGNLDAAVKKATQFFFVNGRFMRHPYFHKAVVQAYDRMLPPDLLPPYFIYFDIDPANIDVNVHPTKTEIKFEHEREIWTILMVCIKEALGKFNVIPSIDFNTEGQINIPVESQGAGNPKFPQPTVNPSYNPFNTTGRQSQSGSKMLSAWQQLYETGKKTPLSDEQTGDESAFSPQPQSQEKFLFDKTEESLFFYRERYVITSVKSGLMLIDRYRAMERISYEQILLQLELQQCVSQKLLFPETLELSYDDNLIFKEMSDDLKALGFDFEPLGEGIYSINGVPALISESANMVGILETMLHNTRELHLHVRTELHHSLALEIARHYARSRRHAPSKEDMLYMIDMLFRCQNPNVTVDGKTIVTILSDEDIVRRFG